MASVKILCLFFFLVILVPTFLYRYSHQTQKWHAERSAELFDSMHYEAYSARTEYYNMQKCWQPEALLDHEDVAEACRQKKAAFLHRSTSSLKKAANNRTGEEMFFDSLEQMRNVVFTLTVISLTLGFAIVVFTTSSHFVATGKKKLY